MRRRSWSDAALPVAAAAAAALVVRPWSEGPWADFGFVTVFLTTVLFLGRSVWRAHRDAGRELDHARGVAGLEVGAVAAAAVGEERSRMVAEIDATVRSSLQAVRSLVGEILERGTEPVAGTRAVQDEARRAMTELRRQLGLLRHGESDVAEPVAAPGRASARHGGRRAPTRGRDALLTAVFIVLAAAEAFLEPGLDPPLAATILSLAYYVGLLAQRAAPVLAAAWMTAVLTGGVALGVPVLDGLAFAVAYGLVLWRLVSATPGRTTLLAALALAGAVLGTRWLHLPDNLPINAVIIVVVVLTGSLVGVSRRSAARARQETAAREAYLQLAREVAVRQERQTVARELHDVASHAVSLIAVQAGAAEVLWAEGRAEAAEATRQLDATAEQALAELDALRPGATTPPATWSEVEAVVRRMEAAGLHVTLEVDGEVPSGLVSTAYRVVQESLTNALRHAPDSRARVTITVREGHVEIVVRNDAPGTAAAQRGFGLVGLQERVAHAGGTLQVGRDEAGDFTLRAVLPARLRVDT